MKSNSAVSSNKKETWSGGGVNLLLSDEK